MANLVYKSNGKQITFANFEKVRMNPLRYRVDMCSHCHDKYRDIIGNHADKGGVANGICVVHGCMHEANYYVDFEADEVDIVENMDDIIAVLEHNDMSLGDRGKQDGQYYHEVEFYSPEGEIFK